MSAQRYPHKDGDMLVLGPEVITDAEGSAIAWKGEVYAKFPWAPIPGQPLAEGAAEAAAGYVVTPLQRATWLLHEFVLLDSQRWQYVYGGAHGVAPIAGKTFPPTKGQDPEGTNPLGYDCSSFQAAGLWHAGMLVSGGITDGKLAPGTQELASWGREGPGQLYTLFVKNKEGVEHCFGKITMPNQPALWVAGRHTGTVCGFQPYSPAYDPIQYGYDARHFPGM